MGLRSFFRRKSYSSRDFAAPVHTFRSTEVTRYQPPAPTVNASRSSTRTTTTTTATNTPLCRKYGCGSSTIPLTVGPNNENGNAGRPYYTCPSCGLFHSWADNVGIHDDNPLCRCGSRSRLEQSGEMKGRKEYYACATGQCRMRINLEWNQYNQNALGVAREMQG